MPREFQDPYTYPGTSVLRNIPGLRSESSLREFEYEATGTRADQLRLTPFGVACVQARSTRFVEAGGAA
jgi:fido (protein-threonine AMPylation protein)